MANPQPDKFTKISNEILEALCHIRIPGEARQVLDCIIRQTYGFNKKITTISLSQFAIMTGLKKCTIIKARLKLLSMNLITQKGNDLYGLEKDFDVWKRLPKKEMLPKKETIVTQKGNLALPKKEISTDEPKDIIKDIYKDNIGDFSIFSINKDKQTVLNTEFIHYVDMRKKLRKPMTEYAVKLAIKHLHKLASGNYELAIKILQKSIRSGWQGLFPYKEEIIQGNEAECEVNLQTIKTGKEFEETQAFEKLSLSEQENKKIENERLFLETLKKVEK